MGGHGRSEVHQNKVSSVLAGIMPSFSRIHLLSFCRVASRLIDTRDLVSQKHGKPNEITGGAG